MNRRQLIKAFGALAIPVAAPALASVVGVAGRARKPSLPSAGGDPLNLPLLQLSDISYLGSFNLPTTCSSTSLEGGYTGLGEGPDGELLFGGAWESARMQRGGIPSIGGTASCIGTLGTAQGTFANNARNFGGMYYHEPTNRIFYQRINSYDNEGNTAAIASCLADMTSHTTPRPVSVSFPMRGTVGYIAGVPTEWQHPDLFDGDCVMGGGPQSINSNTSCGPVCVSFKGADVSSGSGTLPSRTLLGYSGADQPSNEWMFYETNPVNGLGIIPGTRTALFIGTEGETDSLYGQPPDIHGDLCLTGSGFHAYRYRRCFWAFDIRDFIDVRNGVKQRYEPVPYATTAGPDPQGFYGWQAPGAEGNWGCTVSAYMSAFFDPETNRFYANNRWDREVHVWQITPPT